jgi:hypothetical protein
MRSTLSSSAAQTNCKGGSNGSCEIVHALSKM